MRGTRIEHSTLLIGAAALAALLLVLATPKDADSVGEQANARLEQSCEQPPLRPARSIGLPHAGRLRRGSKLPPESDFHFTWDPVRHVAPNRPWRRWATGGAVRRTMRILCEFAAANPDAPRIGVGDLSRRKGGYFGKRFGGIGHDSHQNGVDVDIYYPRLDRLELQPTRPGQIDRELAQDLVNRFIAIKVKYIFVGPRTGLRGRRKIVQRLVHHDDHMHVRFRRGAAAG